MKQFYFVLLLLVSTLCTSQNRDVTYSVDMNGYGGSFTTVYVSGTFNGWSGNSNPLTNQGSGIWSVTLPIAEGLHEYKFTLDDWAVQENFTAGQVCTITNGGNQNRFLAVAGDDIVLSAPIFSSCAEDLADPGPHDITLSVDMSTFGGSLTTVYVSGTFNGWSGTSNPLVDQGGGIWSTTVSITEAFHEFKFSIDDWVSQENFSPADPYTVTNGGFTNRLLQADTNKSLSYIWNQGAVLSNPERVELINLLVHPNPSSDLWSISISDQIIKSIEVFNILGKKILTQNNNSNKINISARELSSGIYFLRVNTDIGASSLKLIRN